MQRLLYFSVVSAKNSALLQRKKPMQGQVSMETDANCIVALFIAAQMNDHSRHDG